MRSTDDVIWFISALLVILWQAKTKRKWSSHRKKPNLSSLIIILTYNRRCYAILGHCGTRWLTVLDMLAHDTPIRCHSQELGPLLDVVPRFSAEIQHRNEHYDDQHRRHCPQYNNIGHDLRSGRRWLSVYFRYFQIINHKNQYSDQTMHIEW